MRPTLILLKKEFQLDLKDKHAWSSVLLYVLSTTYVVYLAFQKVVEPETWNALLWVIILFSSFTVVSRTYDQDKGGRSLYLYTLASAQQVFLAKTFYSMFFMGIVGLITAISFSFFLPAPEAVSHNLTLYGFGIILGSSGLSATLSLISAIAWKTSSNSGLIAILGFPVIIPLLMAIMTFSEGALSGGTWALLQGQGMALALMSVLGVALGYLLFPYLWRD